jgi:hypothetical protein
MLANGAHEKVIFVGRLLTTFGWIHQIYELDELDVSWMGEVGRDNEMCGGEVISKRITKHNWVGRVLGLWTRARSNQEFKDEFC